MSRARAGSRVKPGMTNRSEVEMGNASRALAGSRVKPGMTNRSEVEMGNASRALAGSRVKPGMTNRAIVATILIVLCIPLTIVLGVTLLNDRSYYFISLIIIVLAMLPFALVYEGRRPQARDLVVVAVLVAIAVVGRAAFFMVPQFKPVVAIVIIAGVSLGAESGFIVGALTGFISNFIFGQGPWTPWQMFAMGIIGFLAGIIFSRKTGRRTPSVMALCIFGGLSTFVIYGLVADASAVLMFTSKITKEVILSTYAMGIPFNAIHAAATVIFLLILAKPMIEKLTRVKKKYGLVGG